MRFSVQQLLIGAVLAVALAALPVQTLQTSAYGREGARARGPAAVRRQAEEALRTSHFADASHLFQLEADLYRQLGDENAAEYEEARADRWATHLQVSIRTPPDRQALLGLYTGAKYEPVYGCYVGAFVGNDDRLDSDIVPGVNRDAQRVVALGARFGKPLAVAWDYCSYGSPFPSRWTRALLQQGIAPQIAWEPNRGLWQVNDDGYLQQFARDAAACNGPIFLRFASEMNGSWTAYHSDPAAYRLKFRLVHDVMARLAPNVAMVWCPNSIPTGNETRYYPGDDAVDWVGVNIYSVLHHDNDPSRPADFEDPTGLLSPIYHRYGARKPIAICEFGASHREKLNVAVDRSDVAEAKIGSLLAALPRRFPRVKLVGFFDSDNLTARYIVPGRDLSDYSVTDSALVTQVISRGIAADYFLPRVVTTIQQNLPLWEKPLSAFAVNDIVPGPVSISAWAKSYEPRPTVQYLLDGKPFASSQAPGEHRVYLGTLDRAPGRHLLTVRAVDGAGRIAGSSRFELSFAPVIPARSPSESSHRAAAR